MGWNWGWNCGGEGTKLPDWHLQKEVNFRWCAHVHIALFWGWGEGGEGRGGEKAIGLALTEGSQLKVVCLCRVGDAGGSGGKGCS